MLKENIIPHRYPPDHLPRAVRGKIDLTWGKLMQFISNKNRFWLVRSNLKF